MKWVYVEDSWNLYEVSEYGDVRRSESKELLSPGTDIHGYKFFNLNAKGWKKTISVHRLVALNFLGEPPAGLMVDHIDGNKQNNHYSNLQYVSNRINQLKGLNCKRKMASKYPGVSWDSRSKRWLASIKHNHKKIYLGYHKEELDARDAYLNFVLWETDDLLEHIKLYTDIL